MDGDGCRFADRHADDGVDVQPVRVVARWRSRTLGRHRLAGRQRTLDRPRPAHRLAHPAPTRRRTPKQPTTSPHSPAITPTPATAWTVGSRVLTKDGNEAYWDGTQWELGRAPAAPITGGIVLNDATTISTNLATAQANPRTFNTVSFDAAIAASPDDLISAIGLDYNGRQFSMSWSQFADLSKVSSIEIKIINPANNFTRYRTTRGSQAALAQNTAANLTATSDIQPGDIIEIIAHYVTHVHAVVRAIVA